MKVNVAQNDFSCCGSLTENDCKSIRPKNSEFNPFVINYWSCFTADDIGSFRNLHYATGSNSGNLYTTYSFFKDIYGYLPCGLPHIKNVSPYFHEHLDTPALSLAKETCTHLIIFLQDCIQTKPFYNWEELADLVEYLDKPVIIPGLGANATQGRWSEVHQNIPSNLKRFLMICAERSSELGVRGEITAEVLHKLGIDNVNIIGCPSYYECGPERLVPAPTALSMEDILLTRTIDRREWRRQPNHIIVQDLGADDKWLLNCICFNDFSYVPDIEKRSLYEKLLVHKIHYFSEIDEWKNFCKNFKFAYGSRVHGAIVALNAGIPAMVSNGDLRSYEMCKLFGIPHSNRIASPEIVLRLARGERVDSYSIYDVDNINKKYKDLYSNYKQYLYHNGLTSQLRTSLKDKVRHAIPLGISIYPDGFDIKCRQKLSEYKIAEKVKVSSDRSNFFVKREILKDRYNFDDGLFQRLYHGEKIHLVADSDEVFIFLKKIFPDAFVHHLMDINKFNFRPDCVVFDSQTNLEDSYNVLDYAFKHNVPALQISGGLLNELLGLLWMTKSGRVTYRSDLLYFACNLEVSSRVETNYKGAVINHLNDNTFGQIEPDLKLTRKLIKGLIDLCGVFKSIKFETRTAKSAVLVFDQPYLDVAVEKSYGTYQIIQDLITAALDENPASDVFVFPALRRGNRVRGYLDLPRWLCYDRVKILNPDNSGDLVSLLINSHTKYTCSSELAFCSQLLGGGRIEVFGWPVYGGWGFTNDRNSWRGDRKRVVSLEEFFFITCVNDTFYCDPDLHKKCSLSQLLNGRMSK